MNRIEVMKCANFDAPNEASYGGGGSEASAKVVIPMNQPRIPINDEDGSDLSGNSPHATIQGNSDYWCIDCAYRGPRPLRR